MLSYSSFESQLQLRAPHTPPPCLSINSHACCYDTIPLSNVTLYSPTKHCHNAEMHGCRSSEEINALRAYLEVKRSSSTDFPYEWSDEFTAA